MAYEYGVHYVKCFVVFSVNWRGCLIVARGVARLTFWSFGGLFDPIIFLLLHRK